MANLQEFQAKVCLTAAGCLVQGDRVLLIKHKKLGLWLNPGGHLEDNEMPHQAAEREFWEETGVKVKAVPFGLLPDDGRTEYLPNPVATNLHWVSQENYDFRTSGKQRSEKTEKNWSKGCEQHLNFVYLVGPVDGVEFAQNIEETDGIAWFTLDELKKEKAAINIVSEVEQAMKAWATVYGK